MKIKMEHIVEAKNNPRTILDDEPMKELTLSVEKEGVKDPITVRSLAVNKYEIIYGHRRVRPAKKTKKSKK